MTPLPTVCSTELLASVETRARSRELALAWRDQPLPPGCEPRRARLGVEVTASGRALLLVDRGIRYSGDDATLQAWFATGVLEFEGFDELRAWSTGPFAATYGGTTSPAAQAPAQVHDVTALTDLDAVVTPSIDGPASVDADLLLQRLQLEVRGQDVPLSVLAKRVREHVGRVNPRRPLTIFAVGPTGVGKTLAARRAADLLSEPEIIGHRSAYRFLRLDMSEYQESHRVSQLFGAPQGYIGYGDGAVLTRALAAEPRTFVLFDEIEKAHPDVLMALLNAMDAGRLGDPTAGGGSGEVDCRRAVLFFTSNLDASAILAAYRARQDSAQPDPPAIDALCRTQLRRSGIRPELLGRIRTFLVFDELSPAAVAEVAVLSAARVVEEFGLRLRSIAPEIVSTVIADGDASFGARPLEYVVTALLADQLIELAMTGYRGDVDVALADGVVQVAPVKEAA